MIASILATPSALVFKEKNGTLDAVVSVPQHVGGVLLMASVRQAVVEQFCNLLPLRFKRKRLHQLQ
jgi:hypothetical protein